MGGSCPAADFMFSCAGMGLFVCGTGLSVTGREPLVRGMRRNGGRGALCTATVTVAEERQRPAGTID